MKHWKVSITVVVYLLFVIILAWFVWGHNRVFDIKLPIDFDGFGTIGDFVGGIFGTLFAFLAVYFAWQTFKKETIKSHFFEMLKRHKDNVLRIQNLDGVDIFDRYIPLLIEIYLIFKDFFNSREYDKGDIFKLSYLFFFYGSQLNDDNIPPSINIKKEDVKSIKAHFEDNNVKLSGYGNELGIYFRQLYQIVTFIDEQRCLAYKEKYRYIKSLRVCLNLNEQYILFLNSLSTFGNIWELAKKKDKDKLITKYNLLKNIPETYKLKLKDFDFENIYPNILYEYWNGNKEKEKQRKTFEKKYSNLHLRKIALCPSN